MCGGFWILFCLVVYAELIFSFLIYFNSFIGKILFIFYFCGFFNKFFGYLYMFIFLYEFFEIKNYVVKLFFCFFIFG